LLLWRLVPGFFGYRTDDVAYTALPVSGGNALAATVVPAILGAVHHAVVSRAPDPARLWDICIDHGCTTWANGNGLATAVYRPPSWRRRRGAARGPGRRAGRPGPGRLGPDRPPRQPGRQRLAHAGSGGRTRTGTRNTYAGRRRRGDLRSLGRTHRGR